MSFFDKLKLGLEKTRKSFSEQVSRLVSGNDRIDDEMLDDLEAILLCADVGGKTAAKLISEIKTAIRKGEITAAEQLTGFLKERVRTRLEDAQASPGEQYPKIIMVVGVNGAGKTTTIGKLGHYYHGQGKKVILAAGDTFRAAAIDQLEVWGHRASADVIKHKEGSDPAAVTFDAVQAFKARKADVLIIDTAGRLHNKSNLMDELKKMHRVVEREFPEASYEVLLVLDATTGQNAITQAKVFGETAQVAGVVLTKLDGTAKGGVIVAIKEELGLPVKWVGVGEGIDDLRPFEAGEFTEALFSK